MEFILSVNILSNLRKVRYIHWDKEIYDSDNFPNLVKKIYISQGYKIYDKHGNLEQGSDFLAFKYNQPRSQIIERLGIQVTLAKADKERTKDATTAFSVSDQNDRIDSFFIYALKGQSNDFNSHLARLEDKIKENTVVFNREEIEKQILHFGVVPDTEFFYHWEDFKNSLIYESIMKIGDILALGEADEEREFRKKRADMLRPLEEKKKTKFHESELEATIESIDNIVRELNLLMRKMESIQTICKRGSSDMLKTVRNDIEYLNFFWKSIESLYLPVIQVLEVFNKLKDFPLILRLFWISSASSHRAILSLSNPSRENDALAGREQYFFFFNWDGIEASQKGDYSRVSLISAIDGLGRIAEKLKVIIERILKFKIHDKQSLLLALEQDTRSHPF